MCFLAMHCEWIVTKALDCRGIIPFRFVALHDARTVDSNEAKKVLKTKRKNGVNFKLEEPIGERMTKKNI